MAIAILGVLIIFLIVIVRTVAEVLEQPRVDDSLAHWHITIPGLVVPDKRFYNYLLPLLKELALPGSSFREVPVYETHLASFQRPYIRVRSGNLRYFVFAAPLGKSFFISTWLIYQRPTMLRVLASLPLIGWLVSGLDRLFSANTLYAYDAALHFGEIHHALTMKVIDDLMVLQNMERLPAEARKPMMRELYSRPQAPQLAL